MTDKDFKALNVTIKRLLNTWGYNLGFRHWDINYKLERDYSSDNRDICAETSISWEYMDMMITFYGHKLEGKDEAAIEEIVIHELSHALVNEMRAPSACCEDQSDDMMKHEERVVTMITNAITWSYRDGFEKGSKNVKAIKKATKPGDPE